MISFNLYLKFCVVVPFFLFTSCIRKISGHRRREEDLYMLVDALRDGDSNPTRSIVASSNHNRNVISSNGGCRNRGPKLVNLGLPRTGTLSFIKVMEDNFGLKACHQLPFHWQRYLKEIETWKDKPYKIGLNLRKALRSCVAFSDIPNFALYRSFESQYPSTRFVMTTRGQASWLNSTEVLMKLWKGRIAQSQLRFIQSFFGVDNSVGWGRAEYIETWERHTLEVLKHFENRVLLLPVEFSDSEKLAALSTFIGCTPKQVVYARSHVSRRSQASNSLQTLGQKCIQSPKKCGF